VTQRTMSTTSNAVWMISAYRRTVPHSSTLPQNCSPFLHLTAELFPIPPPYHPTRYCSSDWVTLLSETSRKR